jgi:hypothetical protein
MANTRGSGARNTGGTPYRNPALRPGETMQQRQQRRRQENAKSQQEAKEERERDARESQTGAELQAQIGPKTNVSQPASLRYPKSAKGGGSIAVDSDYVLFEFYKYAPPFGKQRTDANFTEREPVTTPRSNRQQARRSSGVAGKKRTDLLRTVGAYYDYNQSKDYTPAGEDYPSIIMYMPEDISTGFRGNWGGKAFSNIGADLLKSAGAEGLNKLDGLAKTAADTFERLPAMVGSIAIRKAIQKITGDNLSNDDVFGSISGAILNPNTELLFNSVDMRNFQLNFKMVPRNFDEAEEINNICKTFKMCTLPSRNPGKVFGMSKQGITAGFIGVPNLIKVSFMKGSGLHPVLPIYKMCALTQVDVNYTPDGAYATYNDELGNPVATGLTLNFQETKIVFSEEIANNTIR